jgi:hypothetical protein
MAYHLVPPDNKRTNTAERAIQTFKRHFVSVLASTHPAFPINHWPELLPQAEMTLNMMRPYADLLTISAYNGAQREPYDFLSHPIAPCGTLIVAHNPRRETWDNFGTVGFHLGPSLEHYRSYRCLTSDSDEIRISDNIILYPAPLVLSGASRFDQLLSLARQLQLSMDTAPCDQPQFSRCLQQLTQFLNSDATTQSQPTLARPTPLSTITSSHTPALPVAFPASPMVHVPVTASTRHRPTSDTGTDLIG